VWVGGGLDLIHRADFSMGAFIRNYLDKKGIHNPRGR
jgi:hypothetical protein